jgi:gliding motility-associated-like protein
MPTMMRHLVPDVVRSLAVATLLTVVAGTQLHAQTCDNADFGTGDFTNWVGRTGSCCAINTPTAGIVNGRHTIMVGNGTDPNACNDITVVAPGYTQSARLGNAQVGAQGERLLYTYGVTAETSLFIYRYAVVMEDPGHTPAQQPRFEIRVLNAGGQVISQQCGYYQVTAAANIAGFRSCGAVRYRAWTPVGIDLSGQIGQNVTIEFSTGDCSLGGHYGYAYIVGECSPLEIQVDYCPSNSNQAILTAPSGFDYQWSTGQTTQQITITDPPNGSVYSCTLTAVTGCQVTLNANITSTAVVAGFNYPPPCPGVPIQFTDESTSNIGNLISWNWNFGDGNTSTDRNPIHTYALSGLYTVTLTAQTDAGCFDTYSTTVNVNPFPQAGYTVPTVCDGSPSQFINTTLFPPTIGSWEWDFGDGSAPNTTEWNPLHPYAVPGTYNTRFIARSQNGVCTDTVEVVTTVAQLPIASFDMEDVCFGEDVVMTNTSQGAISNFRWEFGDNSPPSFFQNTTHSYITPGTYDVTLEIVNQQGCGGTVTQSVTVSPSPISNFSFTNVCQGQPMPFTNSSTIPPAGNTIGSWVWDFGDGTAPNTSTWEPQHTYNAAGVYDVMLITRSQDMVCNDTLIDSVRVYALPLVGFTFEDVCDGKPVQFTNLSAGEIDNWKWEFGDNTPPNFNANISHTYPGPGTYTVQLTVTTIYGCSDFMTGDVTVHPSPTVAFTSNTVCQGDTTTLWSGATVPAPGTITNLGWNLGDGSPPRSGNSVSHLYGFAGNFNVKHMVMTSEGCIDSLSQPVTVHPNPIVDFAGEPTEGCAPVCVDFYELSGISTGFNETFVWDFGDGSGIAQQNPSHCYLNPTTNVVDRWTVTLSVTSNQGCSTTRTKNNYITTYPLPIARFDVLPRNTSILFPNINFTDMSIDAVQWLWNFGDEQVNNTSNLQHPRYTYLDSGEYVITQIVFNEHGCTDTTNYKIIVSPAFTVYIPNTFTPDDNGVNDVFLVKGTGIIDFEMSIFNRWGQQIFFSDDIEKGWSGDVDGNGDIVQIGTYVYAVRVRDIFGEDHWHHGRVNVLR